jgi:Thioredoxin
MKVLTRFLILVFALGFGTSAFAQLSYPPAKLAQALGAKLNGSSFKLAKATIKLEVLNGLVTGLSYTGGARNDIGAVARVLAVALEQPESAPNIEASLQRSASRFRDVGTIKPGFSFETELELRWAKTFDFRLNLKRFSGFGPDRHVMGNSGPMIREFSDFECPYCKQLMLQTMPSLRSRFINTGLARFAFHHLPLTSIHPHALEAGIAAECAGVQGKFFAYHDLLFTLGLSDLGGLARTTQLNVAAFDQCLKSESSKQIVLKEASFAEQLQINSTPSVFVGPFKLPNANDLNAYARYLQMARALK